MTLEKAIKVVEHMAGAPSDDERSLDIAVATLIVRMQAEIDTLKERLREASNEDF